MRDGMKLRKVGCRLRFAGRGGRRITEAEEMRQAFDDVRTERPDVLLIMIGGNDIDFDTEAGEIASAIEVFASRCVWSFGIRQVIVCKVMPRFKAPRRLLRAVPRFERRQWETDYFAMYKSKAREINRLLACSLRSRNVRFWDHSGKFKANTCRHKYESDGIHLNDRGHWHLYKSLRGAIISALDRY